MKLQPYKIFGAVLVLVAVAGLIHPNFTKETNKGELQFGSENYIVETTRIVTIPWYLSALVALAGAAFIFLPPRKR
ncbi:MAG: hypothetical protein WA175_01250 [Candidatus Acidiferrales bacterium]